MKSYLVKSLLLPLTMLSFVEAKASSSLFNGISDYEDKVTKSKDIVHNLGKSDVHIPKTLLPILEEPQESIPVTPLSPRTIDRQKRLIADKTLSLWGIALFSGNEPISEVIRLVTISKWSHVGLIFKDQEDELYSFEATGSLSQIITEHTFPHVQIAKWKDAATDYNGSVAYRQFIFANDNHGDKDKLLTDFVKTELGKPYEKNFGDLIRALARKNKERGNKDSSSNSLFCSELTAKCLISLGYLEDTRRDDNYLPKDFSDKEFLPLNGVKLTKEIRVKNARNCAGCIIV